MPRNEYGELKVGSFYWVLPEFDVDFGSDETPFEERYHHWTQSEQPARFEGVDENGNEKWIYLGQDVDETNWWPIRWMGAEIIAK